VLSTSTGVVGSLPGDEVDWYCNDIEQQKLLLKPGDIFQAMIVKIHPTKERVIFSKKALDQHPMDNQLSDVESMPSIPGVVVSVLDYGCFVQLEPYGIQGLLHRSKIQNDRTFIKGEHVNVRIETVDKINRRMSLVLAETFGQ
jgi:small subunit ribosomal protein S1